MEPTEGQIPISEHFQLDNIITTITLSPPTLLIHNQHFTHAHRFTFYDKFYVLEDNFNNPTALVLHLSILQLILHHENPSIIDRWTDLLLPLLHKTTFYEDYTLHHKLSSTTTSKVYLMYQTLTNTPYAIKSFSKSSLDSTSFLALQNELNISRIIHHEHIVKLYASYETERSYYLVYELAEGNCLDGYLRERRFKRKEIKWIFNAIVNAVMYLHKLGIAHCDLKPNNIIYNAAKKQLKIIDFGFATLYNQSLPIYPHCGSIGYVAPERLQPTPTIQPINPSIEVYSLGVILHQLLFNRLPYAVGNYHMILRENLLGRIEMGKSMEVGEEEYDILRKMLAHCSKRINIEDVVEHPYLVGRGRGRGRDGERIITCWKTERRSWEKEKEKEKEKENDKRKTRKNIERKHWRQSEQKRTIKSRSIYDWQEHER